MTRETIHHPAGRSWRAVAATVMFLSAPLAAAAESDAGAALAVARKCYACHHPSNTLIGPSYQAIAARHRDRRDVMTIVLARRIVDGGGGNWGLVPMVPNPQISEAEARVIAEWILEPPR